MKELGLEHNGLVISYTNGQIYLFVVQELLAIALGMRSVGDDSSSTLIQWPPNQVKDHLNAWLLTFDLHDNPFPCSSLTL